MQSLYTKSTWNCGKKTKAVNIKPQILTAKFTITPPPPHLFLPLLALPCLASLSVSTSLYASNYLCACNCSIKILLFIIAFISWCVCSSVCARKSKGSTMRVAKLIRSMITIINFSINGFVRLFPPSVSSLFYFISYSNAQERSEWLWLFKRKKPHTIFYIKPSIVIRIEYACVCAVPHIFTVNKTKAQHLISIRVRWLVGSLALFKMENPELCDLNPIVIHPLKRRQAIQTTQNTHKKSRRTEWDFGKKTQKKIKKKIWW